MLSREGRRFMEQAPHLALWPGLCLTIVVYSFNMLGDAMRDLLDPRLRGGGGRLAASDATSVLDLEEPSKEQEASATYRVRLPVGMPRKSVGPRCLRTQSLRRRHPSDSPPPRRAVGRCANGRAAEREPHQVPGGAIDGEPSGFRSAGVAVQGGGALGVVCRQPPRAGGAAGLPSADRAVPPPRVRVLRGLRGRRRCGVPRGAGAAHPVAGQAQLAGGAVPRAACRPAVGSRLAACVSLGALPPQADFFGRWVGSGVEHSSEPAGLAANTYFAKIYFAKNPLPDYLVSYVLAGSSRICGISSAKR